MPLLQLKTSAEITPNKKNQLLTDLSGVLSKVTGKPEAYVMITIQHADTCMAGESCIAAFVDIRGIGGLDPETNKKLSKAVCDCLFDNLGIEGDKIYINFTDIKAANWGWDGGTF